MPTRAYAAALAYILSVVGANWAVDHYGFVSAGFGLTVAAGTYFAGAALFLRDAVQDAWGRFGATLAVLIGAALTLAVSPALAVASASAFLISELADMGVYTPLRERGWGKAVIVSGLVGGVVDTIVFLHIAGFPITGESLGGQVLVKVGYMTLIPVAAVSAVRRYTK